MRLHFRNQSLNSKNFAGKGMDALNYELFQTIR